MILGIGNDLCDIRRIAKSLERFGDRFIQRIFTEIEQKRSEGRATRAASYAKRFAAKEACAKALGTGLRRGVFWRDMGVINLRGGRPTMALTGGALARLQEITPAGQTLLISDSGIEATNGDAILFMHDGQGRIISATAPNGQTATYSYDAAGNLIDVQISGQRFYQNYAIAQKMRQEIAAVPGATDVHINQIVYAPEFHVNVDRSRAQTIGLSEANVANSGDEKLIAVALASGIMLKATSRRLCEQVCDTPRIAWAPGRRV